MLAWSQESGGGGDWEGGGLRSRYSLGTAVRSLSFPAFKIEFRLSAAVPEHVLGVVEWVRVVRIP